jgi:hypothetical protein
VVPSPRIYNNYSYYYPYYPYYSRRYAPYGYGAFGLGYFNYDPYVWPSHGWSAWGYYGQQGYGYDIGELRLQVTPRQAEVFVDGYYAGVVDDYDGAFQALRLESGGYHIEIVAPGYDPLAFDVRISPGQKTTYRGDLQKRP